MVDIQYATAENKRGKRKEEEETRRKKNHRKKKIMACHIA